MKTITITEAKRQLGSYLKRAVAGEDIGIISGADIISLRKVEIVSRDAMESNSIREEPPNLSKRWPKFPVFDGGPMDASIHHDDHLYKKRGK